MGTWDLIEWTDKAAYAREVMVTMAMEDCEVRAGMVMLPMAGKVGLLVAGLEAGEVDIGLLMGQEK
jgi:hypothetical protein